MKLLLILIPMLSTACGTTQEHFEAQSKSYCESLTKMQYCDQSNFDACFPVLKLNCVGE